MYLFPGTVTEIYSSSYVWRNLHLSDMFCKKKKEEKL